MLGKSVWPLKNLFLFICHLSEQRGKCRTNHDLFGGSEWPFIEQIEFIEQITNACDLLEQNLLFIEQIIEQSFWNLLDKWSFVRQTHFWSIICSRFLRPVYRTNEQICSTFCVCRDEICANKFVRGGATNRQTMMSSPPHTFCYDLNQIPDPNISYTLLFA